MASKSIVGKVASSELDYKLSSTIMGSKVNDIDSFLMSKLSNSGDNVEYPSISYLAESNPDIGHSFIQLYNGTMGLVKGVEVIPDEVKILQGALLDGLCYGYDVATGDVDIYTMNIDLLADMSDTSVDMTKQIMDKNKKAELKAYRIDAEYTVSSDEFTFKAVNHRKKLDIDETVIMIPYLAGIRMMKMIETFLNSNMVLKTSQTVNGGVKMRCITKNKRVLEKFCDSPSAVSGVESSFFPMRGFFYAPVVGAPSTTAMVTNIRLFALDEIQKVDSVQALRKLGVEKPDDPVEQMLTEQVIVAKMMELKGDEEGGSPKFKSLVSKLPRVDDLIPDQSDVSSATISKYLHSLSKEEISDVSVLVPGASRTIGRRCKVFTDERPFTEDEMKDLRGTLKKYICRFIIRKKDCSLSSITCTNSNVLLSDIYGDDYFKTYEGFGVRFYELLSEIYEGRASIEALESNGFEVTDESVKLTDEARNNPNNAKLESELKALLSGAEGVKTRSSSSANSIMVRTLSAYLVNGSSVDYYRNVDPSKIVRASVLSDTGK